MPSNPSQEPPAHSHPYPHSAVPDGTQGKAESPSMRANKKRKGSKARSEVSPKSRRTKKSVKASKGVRKGQLPDELEDDEYAAGEAPNSHHLAWRHDAQRTTCASRPANPRMYIRISCVWQCFISI